eukprot:g26750.t1
MDRLHQVKEAGMKGRVGHGGGDEKEGWSWDDAGGWRDFETGKVHIETIGLLGPEAEYEVLLLQFVGGIIVTLEGAQDGHVAQGVGWGVETVGDRKVLSFVVNGAQVLYKTSSEPPLGLTNVEEVTTGAADTGNHVDGCAGEPLFDVEVCFVPGMEVRGE